MFVSTAFAQTATEAQPVEAVHTETGIAHEPGTGGVFPPFDSTHYASQLLWLAITFGLFYLFMSRVVVPRIGGVIETRRDRIAQDLDQAARLKQDADNAIIAYETELSQARTKAAAIANEAREKAKAEAEAERSAVEKALEAKLEKAESSIAAIKAKAMSDVGSIAEETAANIIDELIGTKVDQSTVTAAVKAVSA